MGLTLQFFVVFFALAAPFSLTFATHYHDGVQIKEVEIEGEFYCSPDGNKQTSSTRGLYKAKISLSCDEGETILYESTTESDGECEMEIEDQAKVDTIMADVGKCAIYVHLPVQNCLHAPSNGFFQAYLDPNVKYVGHHAHIKILHSNYVSCL